MLLASNCVQGHSGPHPLTMWTVVWTSNCWCPQTEFLPNLSHSITFKLIFTFKAKDNNMWRELYFLFALWHGQITQLLNPLHQPGWCQKGSHWRAKLAQKTLNCLVSPQIKTAPTCTLNIDAHLTLLKRPQSRKTAGAFRTARQSFGFFMHSSSFGHQSTETAWIKPAVQV